MTIKGWLILVAVLLGLAGLALIVIGVKLVGFVLLVIGAIAVAGTTGGLAAAAGDSGDS